VSISKQEVPPDVSRDRRSGISGDRVRRALSYRNIGVIYVLLAIIIIFSIWLPDLFPTIATVRQVLNGNEVTALIGLSLVIPLSARVFDLSVAYNATLSGVTTSYFLTHGLSIVPAVALGLGAALLVGLINALVVVVLAVDSFIATLATGSLILALISMITSDTAITSVQVESKPFSDIAQNSIGGITLPVFYVLVIGLVLWFVLEHTATGRRIYATGFNVTAARLGGVKTDRLRFMSLLISGLLAGVAGIVLSSTISAGDPTEGTPYLLSGFAAVFLGATQFHPGRFNVWGTLVSVLLLGTGVVGLSLANAPTWSANMFQGLALIAALAATGRERRAIRMGGRRRLRRGTTSE
jgi:ribose/xylose/arabinose/galactoside ABC-type transport system permease subunit